MSSSPPPLPILNSTSEPEHASVVPTAISKKKRGRPRRGEELKLTPEEKEERKRQIAFEHYWTDLRKRQALEKARNDILVKQSELEICRQKLRDHEYRSELDKSR